MSAVVRALLPGPSSAAGAGGDPSAWPPNGAGGELLASLVADLATRDPSVNELLQAGASRLADVLGDTVIVSLLSDDGRWLHPLGVADPDPEVARVLEHFATSRLRADRGFTKHVVATGEPILLPQTSPAVVLAGRPELAPYVARFGIRSMMFTPMRARGRCIGHIAALRTREDAGPYMPAMERFAGLVADLLAIGVESGHPASAHPVGGMKRPGDLSDREREVLVLLALGHTNREIAERLVLSVRTVEWHRARIQWKLGVSGRAALARVARTEGLMD